MHGHRVIALLLAVFLGVLGCDDGGDRESHKPSSNQILQPESQGVSPSTSEGLPSAAQSDKDSSKPRGNASAEAVESAASDALPDVDAATKDPLEGAWTRVSINGRPVSKASGATTFFFKAGDLTITGRVRQRATYTIHNGGSPKQVDVNLKEGRNSIPFAAIYEIDGGQLVMCWANPVPGRDDKGNVIPKLGKRPTDFDPRQGRVYVLRRLFTAAEVVTFGRPMPWIGQAAITFHPDGNMVAVTLGSRILLWDVNRKAKIAEIRTPDDTVIGYLEFSRDGEKLVSVAGLLREGATIWDVATGKSVHGMEDVQQFATFSPDGKRLAARLKDSIKILQTDGWQLEHTLPRETDVYVRSSAAFSPDGKLLALATQFNEVIRVWDVTSGKLVATLEGKSGDKTDLAFHPDGTRLAVVGRDGPLEIWDVSDTRLVTVLPGTRGMECVDFSPDGRYVATGGGHVYIWDVETEQLTGMAEAGCDTLTYSPNGKLLALSDGHVSRVLAIDGSAASAESTVWPPPLTAEEERRFAQLERFFSLNNALQNASSSFGRKARSDAVDEDGKPLLSWRFRLLPFLEEDIIFRKFRLEPWDSQHNAQLASQLAPFFGAPGVEAGHTVWLRATGPGTAHPDGKPAKSIPDGGGTIIVVEASPDRSVPWSAPRDFVFDPDDPWAGLPKQGFPAIFADSSIRFVKSDTPSDTLNALFTPDGGEEVDLESVTEPAFDRYMYGP